MHKILGKSAENQKLWLRQVFKREVSDKKGSTILDLSQRKYRILSEQRGHSSLPPSSRKKHAKKVLNLFANETSIRLKSYMAYECYMLYMHCRCFIGLSWIYFQRPFQFVCSSLSSKTLRMFFSILLKSFLFHQ